MKNIIYFFIFILFYTAQSQSISIFDIDVSDFPTVKAKFYASDAQGKQILNISPIDVEIYENGEKRIVTNISCPIPQPPKALSSVLVIDISGSMYQDNLELAKKAARAWLEALPFDKSECAITAFNSINFLIQDFTNDKNLLLNKVNSLSASGGTSYEAALYDPPAGALLVSKKGKNQRIIVLLTDGQAYTPNIEQIINEANQQNCIIYVVTLKMSCPDSLKEIAKQTGGEWFENISTSEEAKNIYLQILKFAQGSNPCLIEWESDLKCNDTFVNIEAKFLKNGISDFNNYKPTKQVIAHLEFQPKSINFKNKEIGIKHDTTITVTARNADFNITDILYSNPAFFIVPNNFYLAKGQNRTLTLSFVPPDSGYTYSDFEFVNELCQTKYYSVGGFFGIRPSVQTLKLIHPNGGETFVVGSDTVITWEGVLPDEPVKIEYTTNNGVNWLTVVENTNGLSYNWTIPKTPSNECLARVTAKAHYIDCGDVLMCEQIWMGCNLSVEHYRNGDSIRYARNMKDWADAYKNQEGAWYSFYTKDEDIKIFGHIYNWFAVNDPRGLAPDGWRVPSDNDWKDLERCIGIPEEEIAKPYQRGTIEGGKLKTEGTIEDGTGYWKAPNVNATNEFGFSAVPTGYRNEYGVGNTSKNSTIWWTASPNIVRMVSSSYGFIARLTYSRGYGFSVRCIREK